MKGYLVIGPESSGTRIVTKLLIEAGCKGDASHFQPFDNESLPPSLTPIVWRRSVPMGVQLPNLHKMIEEFKGARYEPHIIIVSRDIHATASSQVSHGHSPDYRTALDNISIAWSYIFSSISYLKNPNTRFTIVNYESLVSGRAACNHILEILGLSLLTQEQWVTLWITNENCKWQGETL